VDRLAFGSVDFQLDTDIPSEGQALLFARSSIVIASVTAKLQRPIDGVTLEIGDTQALKKDIEYAKSLGFGAKICIHSFQVEETLSGFSPNDKEVTWAREVCLASDQAQGSSVRLNGKLIDLPVVLRAKRFLQSFHAYLGNDR
jgi:citrate lyase subunit beta/citryl-CoA lyase